MGDDRHAHRKRDGGTIMLEQSPGRLALSQEWEAERAARNEREKNNSNARRKSRAKGKKHRKKKKAGEKFRHPDSRNRFEAIGRNKARGIGPTGADPSIGRTRRLLHPAVIESRKKRRMAAAAAARLDKRPRKRMPRSASGMLARMSDDIDRIIDSAKSDSDPLPPPFPPISDRERMQFEALFRNMTPRQKVCANRIYVSSDADLPPGLYQDGTRARSAEVKKHLGCAIDSTGPSIMKMSVEEMASIRIFNRAKRAMSKAKKAFDLFEMNRVHEFSARELERNGAL